MIARLRLPRLHVPARRQVRVKCEADDWYFDPRYTQGACPICGWQPEGAPAAPAWLRLVNRVDWDMVGLFALVDILFLLGLVMAHAAGLISGHHPGSVGVPSSHGGSGVGVASAARHH